MSTISIQHPLAQGCPPAWATAWGQDRFGIFIEFSLTSSPAPASQRLRWIPPGAFLMGSPDDEPGRDPDEGPQHEVRLTHGFWLFDTPATQQLWNALMEENASHFVDDSRPVECVSWNDCQGFLKRLSDYLSGFRVFLPTEAQWEYACRAGTTSATHAGPITILGERDAPVLHDIAWYGGNSGVNYDLEVSWDSSDWPEKQFEHDKAGTRRVGKKKPNDWGLHDMLGNVWEWCRDGMRTYTSGSAADPVGPEEDNVHRAVRGGGWHLSARSVRSACRYAFEPGVRSHSLGFRCALVQEEADEVSRQERRASFGGEGDGGAEQPPMRREARGINAEH